MSEIALSASVVILCDPLTQPLDKNLVSDQEVANQILAFRIWIVKCGENQLGAGLGGKKTHPERACSRG